MPETPDREAEEQIEQLMDARERQRDKAADQEDVAEKDQPPQS